MSTDLNFRFGNSWRLCDCVGAMIWEPGQDVAQKLEVSGSSPSEGQTLVFVSVLHNQEKLSEKLLQKCSLVTLKENLKRNVIFRFWHLW